MGKFYSDEAEISMKKDTQLVNIYLKIHNKKPLTLDDLRYLAEYSPECFEKTCENVIHKMPEAKPIMEPVAAKAPVAKATPVPYYQPGIQDVLDNLICLEANELPFTNIDSGKVMDLLGNLYMELLLSHNEPDTLAAMIENGDTPRFDKRV